MSAAIQAILQQALADNATALGKMYANPRPDGSLDGESNQWTALRKSLLEEQTMLLTQIQNCDGPFEIVSYPPSN